MSERTYPRKVWVLMPSFKPIEVEVVKPYRAFGGYDYGDLTDTGKCYSPRDMHATKADAIAAGRVVVVAQQADLAKRHEKLAKRIAALDKAEGGAT